MDVQQDIELYAAKSTSGVKSCECSPKIQVDIQEHYRQSSMDIYAVVAVEIKVHHEAE